MRRAAALCALAGCAAACLAGDEDELARKLAALDRELAGALAKQADSAAKAGLHGRAMADRLNALGLDPDQPDARTGLGFVASGSAWARDPSAQVRNLDEPSGKALETRLEGWRERREKQVLKRARKEVADLVAWCQKKQLDPAPAWSRLLLLEPANEQARQALGWRRIALGARDAWMLEPGEGWIRGPIAEGLAGSGPGESILGGAVAERTGLPLYGRKIGALTVLVDAAATPGELDRLVAHGRLAQTVVRDLLGGPEELRPVELVFLSSEAGFLRFVDTSWPEEPPERRKAMAASYGSLSSKVDGFRAYQAPGQPWREDGVIDSIASEALGGVSKGAWRLRWLNDGFEAHCTLMLHGSSTWHTAGSGTRTRGGGGEDQVPTCDWPLRLRGLVAAGLDRPMARLLDPEETAEFWQDDLIKSQSLVAWLLVPARRALFHRYLAGLDGKRDPRAVLERVFERPLREIEAEWREWVLRR